MHVKQTILVFCLVSAILANANPYLQRFTKRTKWCGDKLATALSLVCNGNYNAPQQKKSTPVLEDFLSDSEYDDEDLVDLFPFLNDGGAHNLVSLKARRGIVNECCYNACDLHHLRLYCGK